MFQEVLTAIEAGKRQRARDMLTRLLKNNPNQPDYWLWMSSVVDSQKERSYCLKEVLKRDPQNIAARRGLALMGISQGDDLTPVPLAVQKRNWRASMPGFSTADKIFLSGIWKPAAAAIGTLVFVALVIIGWVVSGFFNRPVQVTQSVQLPLDVVPVFVTLTPMGRQVKPLPTLLGPTPLAYFLGATYTPTPLYVRTPHVRTESFRSAMFSYQHGDWPQVIEKLNQVLKEEPKSQDAYYYLGEAYRFQKNYKEALLAYDRALKINRDFAPAYLGRARARLEQSFDNWQLVQTDFEKAADLDPNMYEIYLDMAELNLRLKKPDDALKNLKVASSFIPDAPKVHFLAAQAQLLLKHYDQALTEAELSNKLDITFLPAYRLVGEIYFRSGRLNDALSPLRVYTVYIRDDEEALIWLGAALTEYGDLEKAIETLGQVIEIDSKSAEAFYRRGMAYLKTGEIDRSLSDFDQAIALQPSLFDAYIGSSRSYLLTGNFNLAAYNLDKASGYAESDSQLATVYYWRAQALEGLKENDAAQRDWKALLTLSRDEVPGAWVEAARLRVKDVPAIDVTKSTLASESTSLPELTATRAPTLPKGPSPTHQPTVYVPSATRMPTRTLTMYATPVPTTNDSPTPKITNSSTAKP